MFCNKCGNKLNEDDKFCRGCGAPISSGQNNAGSMEGRAQNQAQFVPAGVYSMLQPAGSGAPVGGTVRPAGKSAKGKVLIASIAAVVVVAVGIILYNVLVVPQPVDVVNKFVNAINGKDINTAITCMDPNYELMYNGMSNILSNFTGGVNLSDVADMLPGLYDFGQDYSGSMADFSIKVLNVTSQDISGDNATICVNLEAKAVDQTGKPQTQNYNAVFTLKKFNKGWRIVNMQ